MHLHHRIRAIGLLTILSVLGPSLLGQDSTSRVRRTIYLDKSNEEIAQLWQKRIEKIDRMIKDGAGKKAKKAADSLSDEMLHLMASGEGVGQFLGVVTTLRALAAVQIGDERQGLWHWHLGLQLFPELKDFNLDEYGETGSLLKARAPIDPASETEDKAGARPTPTKITPPKKIFSPRPKFPAARRGLSRNVSVEVQVVIDKEGYPRNPVIRDSRGEFTMVYATLEALRTWRFEPARADGEPVDVYYVLKSNFKARR